MTNPAMPGLLKVGMTARVPELRAADRDMTSTGVPGKFEAQYYSFFNNMVLAEKKVHLRLKPYHYSKEFFKTDILVAITAIESTGLEFTKVFSQIPKTQSLPVFPKTQFSPVFPKTQSSPLSRGWYEPQRKAEAQRIADKKAEELIKARQRAEEKNREKRHVAIHTRDVLSQGTIKKGWLFLIITLAILSMINIAWIGIAIIAIISFIISDHCQDEFKK